MTIDDLMLGTHGEEYVVRLDAAALDRKYGAHTGAEHYAVQVDMLVSPEPGRRWVQVTCRCGESAREQGSVENDVFANLMVAAGERIACPDLMARPTSPALTCPDDAAVLVGPPAAPRPESRRWQGHTPTPVGICRPRSGQPRPTS